MKKIIALSLFLLSPLVFAQSVVTQNGSGIKYYTYGDKENSQTVISPAPGIFIQTPWWTKDIARGVTDSMKGKPSESSPKSQSAEAPVVGKAEIVVPNVVLPSVVAPEINKSVENQTVKKDSTARTQGQVMITKKNIATNDISIWNRTSQNIIEQKANAKLAQEYQQFLSN